MPQINRIRVNNVKYNFGTQFYDDFVMRFSCKNTIYDLANGGGKSVLMLLLLQNLIPNCTLDEKQPIEKLFRTGNANSAIHSLVEWKLDKENIKDNYKYMLTGFCARRARDEESEDIWRNTENASIEYFNYCIFYREFNDNDLKNLPLTNGKERITYSGLRNYLKDLEKKDFSLKIKIFDRKGEYQRFIAAYGLYESQWEIIRGINKTEGHVRTYFETNYKTARKVVEDLLIEEIIEKSFNVRAAADDGNGRQEDMAQTLVSIKDKLIELSGRKEDISCYDRQIEAIESFIGRISGIRQLYFGREEMEEQLIRASNTLDKALGEREKLRSGYEESLVLLEEEKSRREKQIAVIRVQGDERKMKEAAELTEELAERLSGLNSEYKQKKQELLMLESENDYMDYLYYKEERDAVKAVLEDMSGGGSDKEEIKLKLAAYGCEKRKRNELKKAAIEGQAEKEEAALNSERELLVSLKEQENTYIQDVSVADYMLAEWERKYEELNKSIYKEKERLGMIMSGAFGEELLKLKKELEGTEEKLSEMQKRSVEYAVESSTIDYQYMTIAEKIKEAEAAVNECNALKSKYGAQALKLEKIQELYGEYDTEALYNAIEERYREAIGEADKAAGEIRSLKIYESNLKRGCPVGESSELKEVLSYIEKYHGAVAVSGAAFTAELDSEERAAVISRIPLLPYCIVIKSGYEKIISDAGMREILKGDYAVPLIRLEAVRSEGYIFGMSDIDFVIRDESLFTDSGAMEREQLKTAQRLKDLEERSRFLDEAVLVLKEDLSLVNEYNSIYKEKAAENEANLEELKIKLKGLEKDMELLEERKLNLAKGREELSAAKEELEEKRTLLKEKAAAVEELEAMDKEADLLSGNIRQVKSKGERLKKDYRDITVKIKAVSESINYRGTQLTALRKEIKELEKAWEELYSPYYKELENLSAFGLDLMTDDEIDAKAKALNEILSGAARDLNDKRRLVENYEIAMEKSLEAIDYKGISVDEIINNHTLGKVRSHSREELKAFKAILDNTAATIGQLEKELSQNKEVKDRLEGAVALGIRSIKEKYGNFERFFDGEEEQTADMELKLKELRLDIDGILIKLKGVREKLSELDETDREYIIYRRDLDKITEKTGIIITDRDKVWEDSGDFSSRLKTVSEKYERYEKEVIDREKDLEHEKQVLADTLREVSALRLADEIRNNVVMPKSVSETENLMESLKEIISCLSLEKDRVEKSIRDTECIKDNFENRCIQSCINIKTELERLPKLSKINMDKELLSIIGLSVPYIPENMYKNKMSEYIDNIVDTADKMKTEEERIKYIRGQLSWKRLFSVIVTDMNAVKLTLYKRERIKEQSRYLRYEEAVGSTGQSQGIYIQFLIAIINYITCINSPAAGSQAQGKTIFIDNPFGAAKDIYIWEPIFKLLKTNNVQLIVPCRGATPAITGRFDVNYVLGQKMTDGKQQTVVVEYYSNVESDNLEYEKLSFEQNKFVFD